MGKRTAKVLTNAAIEAAKPDPVRLYELPDAKVPGLALRVTMNGVKSWTLRYRNGEGAQRRLTIGPFPSVTLSDARGRAQRAIGGVSEGADPAKEKRAARAAAQARKLSTVGSLIESYFEDAAAGRHKPNGRPKRTSTMQNERAYYDRLIGPRFGALHVADLGRHELQKFLDEISEKAPASARWCRDVIREAFNYGIRREAVDKNPAQFAALPVQTSRERVLTADELQRIWLAANDTLAIDGLGVAPETGLALMLAMVTLQRGGEVCGIHARELDREAMLWTIPGERTKNHRTHIVPLSSAAVDILDRVFALAGVHSWKGFAFPAPRGGKPMTRNGLSRAMSRLTTKLKIKDATAHDFRRSGASYLTGERCGVARLVVSRILNQVSDLGGGAAVTGVYDRNSYLPEKRRGLDAWARLLAEIASGQERDSNIISLETRAGRAAGNPA